MINSSNDKKIAFIMLISVCYFFFNITTSKFIKTSAVTDTKKILFVSTLLFAFLTYVLIDITGIIRAEEAYKPVNIDPRLCQGGPYMWQGDTDRAINCRQLASTPEGLAQIQKLSCGSGYSGMPLNDFDFTPNELNC